MIRKFIAHFWDNSIYNEGLQMRISNSLVDMMAVWPDGRAVVMETGSSEEFKAVCNVYANVWMAQPRVYGTA